MSQNLKFIHLTNTAAAAEGSYDKGAIIFEPKSGRIAVKGNSGLEYYGGGRIADVKFENSILTISFNDGTTPAITLDFSDVASTSGVNKILGKLRTDVDAIGGRVTTLEGKVATNTSAIDAINDGSNGILAQAKSYTDDKIGDIKLNDAAATVKEYVDAGDAAAKKYADDTFDTKGSAAAAQTAAIEAAKSYTDDEVKKINTAAEALGTRVTTLETKVGESTDAAKADGSVYARIAKNAADIATLVGSDAGKSARTIANEELAAQLIPENAKESLDTLQEIAAWIQSHPDDASKMNGKIAALETKVGDEKSGLVKKANDNATAITALQGLHESGKTVKQEVSDGIAGIVAKSASNDAESDVVVTVTTEAGSVKTVAVDASGLRGDLGVKTAAASADTAFGRIKALETTVGDKGSGLVKAVADNKSSINAVSGDLGTRGEGKGTAFARIEALETAQAAGSLMWSSWDD